jgi:hypothetical protein
VGVASWKQLACEAGAGVRGTDAGNGGGDQGGALGAFFHNRLVQAHEKGCLDNLELRLEKGACCVAG